MAYVYGHQHKDIGLKRNQEIMIIPTETNKVPTTDSKEMEALNEQMIQNNSLKEVL
jgi:hypothetical protein